MLGNGLRHFHNLPFMFELVMALSTVEREMNSNEEEREVNKLSPITDTRPPTTS